jgi:hypothetical protein
MKNKVEPGWEDNPQYPRAVWKAEVAAGDTQRGYWDWVDAKREEGIQPTKESSWHSKT